MAVTHVAYEADGWGVGELWLEDGRVVWHELPWPRAGAGSMTNGRGRGGSPDPSQTPTHPGATRRSVAGGVVREGGGFAANLVRRLGEYFAGGDVTFDDVPLDLEYETPFLERCALALREVPRGEVVTYGELAALAGTPGAARAAGSFCARNRLGLFVPCHRVVAANGLGSYGSFGVGYKQRLLALEGYRQHAV
jgi:methylated-DNA-[protein]-cysteine S-methyltransferase